MTIGEKNDVVEKEKIYDYFSNDTLKEELFNGQDIITSDFGDYQKSEFNGDN